MIKKIGVGRTAEVYDYGDGKVLKLFYKNIADENITTEYNNNKIIELLNITSAKCFDMITYKNRKGIVFEKLSGLTMMKSMEIKPMKAMSYAVPLAKVHSELHKQVNAELPENKNQIITQIRDIDILEKTIKEKLYKYIESLDNDTILCHSDFHPENIFVSNDKFIVFDWSTASIGNKYSDVAHTSLLLRFGVSPNTKNPIELFITNKVRNSFANKYLHEYIRLSQCKKKNIYKWEIPHMASMLNTLISEKTKSYFLKKIEKFINKKI